MNNIFNNVKIFFKFLELPPVTSTSQLSQEDSFEIAKNPPKRASSSTNSSQSQSRAIASSSKSQSNAVPSCSQSQSTTAFVNEPSFDLDDLSFSEDFSQSSSNRQDIGLSKGIPDFISIKPFYI